MDTPTIAIPQSDDLHRLLHAVAVMQQSDGAISLRELAAALAVSPRHAAYAAQALRVLGLASTHPPDGLHVTALGRSFAEQSRTAQYRTLRTLMTTVEPMRSVLALLDDQQCVSRTVVAARLRQLAPLSESTALRRASTILTWLRTLHLAAPCGDGWYALPAQEVARADPAVAAWLAECGI